MSYRGERSAVSELSLGVNFKVSGTIVKIRDFWVLEIGKLLEE